MLELVPSGLLGRRFAVSRDGVVVAELNLALLREAAEITIEGAVHELRRQGRLSGAFELSHHGGVVARARKPSAWRNRFEVEHESRHYELEKESWWSRRYELRDASGPVGGVRPVHVFTRRAEIDLPDELTLPGKVFVTALVAFLWNRDASAAAGGGG